MISRRGERNYERERDEERETLKGSYGRKTDLHGEDRRLVSVSRYVGKVQMKLHLLHPI